MQRRLPAEWEPQDGILLAWPHADTDWSPFLQEVEPVFVELVRLISHHERVVVVAPSPPRLSELLTEAGAAMERVAIESIPSNDTWCRDFGPITVEEGSGLRLLDFGFNGWGLKFAANKDNQISRRLNAAGAFGDTPLQTVGMILEGGGIECDGAGTLLTTSQCLLNANRNPHLSKEEIEAQLREHLGVERILWLHHGYLEGDDTDSHIDTLARLCPDDTIVYVRCDDPADGHYDELAAMETELAALRTSNGAPYRLLPLPWPKAQFDGDGQRLPATYANFLIINDAVLVPTYRDLEKDAQAIDVIGQAFPSRAIIGVDCLPLIFQHGSLHCVTMQIPKGVLPCAS